MMQSCRHRREACFGCGDDFQPHSFYLKLGGLVLSDTRVDIPYASTRDRRVIASGDMSDQRTPRPKRKVSALA